MKKQEILTQAKERIEAFESFKQKVKDIYSRGMEYQIIAKEIEIPAENLSLYINEKRIPTLDNLKRYNERLKKL